MAQKYRDGDIKNFLETMKQKVTIEVNHLRKLIKTKKAMIGIQDGKDHNYNSWRRIPLYCTQLFNKTDSDERSWLSARMEDMMW